METHIEMLQARGMPSTMLSSDEPSEKELMLAEQSADYQEQVVRLKWKVEKLEVEKAELSKSVADSKETCDNLSSSIETKDRDFKEWNMQMGNFHHEQKFAYFDLYNRFEQYIAASGGIISHPGAVTRSSSVENCRSGAVTRSSSVENSRSGAVTRSSSSDNSFFHPGAGETRLSTNESPTKKQRVGSSVTGGKGRGRPPNNRPASPVNAREVITEEMLEAVAAVGAVEEVVFISPPAAVLTSPLLSPVDWCAMDW
jgi:hypothetical protein